MTHSQHETRLAFFSTACPLFHSPSRCIRSPFKNAGKGTQYGGSCPLPVLNHLGQAPPCRQFSLTQNLSSSLHSFTVQEQGRGNGGRRNAEGGSCPPVLNRPGQAPLLPLPCHPMTRPLQAEPHAMVQKDIMAFGDSPDSHREIRTSCSS